MGARFWARRRRWPQRCFRRMGAHAVGLNCSLGPAELLGAAQDMARRSRCPLMVQPNAGLPRVEDGVTVFDVSPEDFAAAMEAYARCGCVRSSAGAAARRRNTRASLRRMADARRVPAPRAYEPACVLCSAQEAVVLPVGVPRIAVIGERINPTGKPKLKAALRAGDLDYLVGEAVSQQEAGRRCPRCQRGPSRA